QAEDGIRDYKVTGVQTCALPISAPPKPVPITTASSWGPIFPPLQALRIVHGKSMAGLQNDSATHATSDHYEYRQPIHGQQVPCPRAQGERSHHEPHAQSIARTQITSNRGATVALPAALLHARSHSG